MGGVFDALGIVVSDMAAAVAFYRRLGLEFPAGAEGEGHAEAALPGGTRLMLDTEETMASFDPGYEAPTAAGRISLAFRCDSPAGVDDLYGELVEAGSHRELVDADGLYSSLYRTQFAADSGVGVDA